MIMNKLTPKQERFIQEYLIDLNATQAALRAGYSKNTAGSIGVENLTKPLIMVEITKGKEKLSKRTEITQERVLREYAVLAFDMPLESDEIRAQDKNKALDSIGKHLGMFVDKVEFSGLEGIHERLAKKIKEDGDSA